MAVLYVVSDQPGAGKTALCTTLAHELGRRGTQTAVFKPVTASGQSEQDPDAAIYQLLLGQPEAVWPWPLPKSGLTRVLLDEIKATSDQLLDGNDLLLVEGSSVVSENASRRLAESLDAQVLLVVTYQPDLDASKLTRWRARFGERLLGFIFNRVTLYQGNSARTGLLESLRSEGLTALGLIPEDRRLLAVTVGHLASHLGGEFVVGDQFVDGLVEHYLIGGLGLDSGQLYFGTRENKAAIVRGDRPDIQMAALATPASCMLLTNGIEPIEYVRYEAELEEVPIVVVQSDTLTTMASLNSVQDSARFDHPAKLERLAELLREHVDLSAIEAGLGLAA